MRIPPSVSGTVSSLGLKTWAGSRDFPRKMYFLWIEDIAEKLAVISPEGEPETRNIVSALVGMLDEEGALLAYAQKKKSVEYDTDEKWMKVCIAAGWAVLWVYAKSRKEGTWPETGK